MSQTPDALSQDEVALIRVQSAHSGASAIAAIFLSLYLFKEGGLGAVALFYIGDYILQTTCFAVAGYMLAKWSTRTLIRVGLILSCAVYAYLIALGHEASHYVFILGCFMGVADGLYWASVNITQYVSTHIDGRNKYFAKLWSANAIFQVLGPLIAGLLLTALAHLWSTQAGYYGVFLLLIATWATSWFLAGKMALLTGVNYKLRDSLGHVDRKWGVVLFQNFLRGLWVEPLNSFAAVLLIVVVRNPLAVTGVSAITTLAVSASSITIGAILQQRPRTYWLGALIVPVGMLGFAIAQNPLGVLCYIIGIHVFDLFANTSSSKAIYDTMETHGWRWNNSFHLIVEREAILNLGRLIGYGVIYWLAISNTGTDGLRIALAFAAVLPILLGASQSHLTTLRNRNAQAAA